MRIESNDIMKIRYRDKLENFIENNLQSLYELDKRLSELNKSLNNSDDTIIAYNIIGDIRNRVTAINSSYAVL